MIIGINDLYQIKQIKEITDTKLKVIELDEMSEFYPFPNWTDTRILCYCYKQTVEDTSIYPYIDVNLIERLEAGVQENAELKIRVIETEQVANNNGLAQQELLELLIDTGVL